METYKLYKGVNETPEGFFLVPQPPVPYKILHAYLTSLFCMQRGEDGTILAQV